MSAGTVFDKLWQGFRSGYRQPEDGDLIWWGIAAMAVAGLLGVCHWILSDLGAERELARERFRLEQDGRALRRSGKLTPR